VALAPLPRGLPAPQFQGPRRALLLACAIDPSAAALAELRALAPRVAWAEVVRLAGRGGVAPLVHRTVKRADLPVPEAPRRQLRAAYAVNAIRNAAIADEVARVSARLEAAGIPVIPLKGAGLMHTLYPDPALRVLSDIDLLVRREQARAAEGVLVGAGYGYVDTGLLLESARRFNHEVVFHRPAPTGGFMVELHFGLLTRFGRGLAAQAWPRARRPDDGVRALAPEDELLFLCAHFMVHLCEPQLKWLVDVAELASAAALDWETVQSRAQALGLATAVHEAGRRAATLLGAPVPALPALQPARLPRAALARFAPAAITLGDARPPAWAQNLLAILMVEGLPERATSTALALARKLWAARAARANPVNPLAKTRD
jgi:hypothetical protein